MTFICPGGEMKIRFTSRNLKDIIGAANTLKAQYFVMVDEWDHAQDLPIWGVFDMRTVNQNSPVPGEVSIRDPIKRFTAETPDAAVMFAVHYQGAHG